jgi:putative transposase
LGTFDPKLIAKYQRRFPDFDDKIISMYARGMTVREIRGHLEELYGIDVSPDLISTVTDAVHEAVQCACQRASAAFMESGHHMEGSMLLA